MITKSDPLVGKILDGRFEIEEVIGSGGAGVVYKAKQLRVNRHVAIKTINMEIDATDVIRERFMNEINSLCALSHPNVVTVYDCILGEDHHPYIVMDYLKGLSLDALLRRDGPLSLEQFARISLQVLSALDHAHKKGIIHRDMKPGNIMLMDDDTDIVKVVDFGLAKLTQSNRSLTKSGELWGSPPYMAPEQANGDPIDTRTDIYGLGAVFYEMLTGKDPFYESTTVYEIIQAHIEKPPPPFMHANPDRLIPPAVQSVIFKSLNKKSDERYQTIAEMQAALVEALSPQLEGASRDYLLRFSTRKSGDQAAPVVGVHETKFDADELIKAINTDLTERAAASPKSTATGLKALGTTAANYKPTSTATNLPALAARTVSNPNTFPGVPGQPADATRSARPGATTHSGITPSVATGASSAKGGGPADDAALNSPVGTKTFGGINAVASIEQSPARKTLSANPAPIASSTSLAAEAKAELTSPSISPSLRATMTRMSPAADSGVAATKRPEIELAIRWLPWAIAGCCFLLAVSLGGLVFALLMREPPTPITISSPDKSSNVVAPALAAPEPAPASVENKRSVRHRGHNRASHSVSQKNSSLHSR